MFFESLLDTEFEEVIDKGVFYNGKSESGLSTFCLLNKTIYFYLGYLGRNYSSDRYSWILWKETTRYRCN